MSEMYEVTFHLQYGATMSTAMTDEAIRGMRDALSKAWMGGKDIPVNIVSVNNTTIIRPSCVTIMEIAGWKP